MMADYGDHIESKALRFINAYNAIDSSLRNIYNFKRNITFSDMIRRATSLNHIVRKYEDKLIDYGRLRNAIVHGNLGDEIIAEPHEKVVIEFEKIAQILSTPPLALETIATRQVLIIEETENLKKVMSMMYKYGFKNLPIYSNGMLIGVANAGRLLDFLGKNIVEGNNIDELTNNKSIGEFVRQDPVDNFYSVVNKHITIEQTLDLFYNNKKLLIVLITENGNFFDKPTGIITIADTMDMNKILDIY